MRYILLFTLCASLLFLGSNCKDEPVKPCTDCPQPEPDSTSHEISWSIDTIGTFQSRLADVWGSDTNNIYAVGLVYVSLSPYKATNIMQWNGNKWNALDYLEGLLISIHGFGSNDIWSVGGWFVDQNAYALITHWNGSQWQTWKLQQYSDLRSIWGTSSNNLFAVGRNGLILHYDGVSWEKMESGTTKFLTKVWGVSDSVIYAIGYSQTDFNGIVLKYDGKKWISLIEKEFRNDLPSGELSGLWGLNSKTFFIDQYGGFDSTWGRFGWPNDNTFIDDIYGTNNKNIFATGSFHLIMHFNGKSIRRYDQFYNKPNGGRLYGIFAIKNYVYVVGGSENVRGIVFRGRQQ